MTRKRFVKLNMSCRISRNTANKIADIAMENGVPYAVALADEVEYELGLKGVDPHHIEGRATGWILLDYNTVVVHLFTPDQRETYSLEHLWGDAKEFDISEIITED